MIPADRDQLAILAGEFVLGVLDADQSREVAEALASDAALQDAVAFWEQQLHPLSALASPAAPPSGTWEAIAARLTRSSPHSAAPRRWNRASLWRWSTAGGTAAAAALLLYVALAPVTPAPPLVAALHAPTARAADWIAVADKSGLRLYEIAGAAAPPAHVFELWAIAPHAKRPEPVGIIPANGTLRLATPPPAVENGATLAISIEPPGGSPTRQPTGPVVFVGILRST